MKKKLLLKSMLLLCALIAGSSSVWADDDPIEVLSWSRSGSDNTVTTGFTFSADASAKSDYYQDKSSGIGYIMVYRTSSKLFSSTPTSITFTAKVGGGSGNKDLSNSVYVCLVDKDGTDIANTEEVVTSHITLAGGDTYNISLSTTDGANAYGVKIYHTKESGYNVRYYSFSLSYVPYVAPAGTTEPPTISGNTPFLDNTTVTITNAGSAEGADIYYTLDGTAPTTTTSSTCFVYSSPFTINATTTVKAIAKKSTDTNASSVVSMEFTKITPLTVSAALTAINALADNGTIDAQYVSGIVSTAGTISDGTINYFISADGSATNQLYVYKGKGLNNENFTASTDIQVGDVVVIFGQLKKYKSGNIITPEINSGNYLISKIRKPAPTFSLTPTETTLDAYTHETVDITLTTNTDGAVTCESSNENVATVALKSGNVYTITAQTTGEATITIKSALGDTYAPASATVAVTVTDDRAEAGISFKESSVSTTWGEEFTGQVLTNTHSVNVSYSSTAEDVATVNESGVVTVLKAGTTTIKATFDGDATYKAAVASYTLTVNKANAGLSYAVTSFDIMLGDDSFVAPTLNNPNGLTVTYASNNTDVAVVDENSGELVYDETAAGIATITATFAGNDNFNNGSASYTINIIDPTVKGSKYNPYTVAEVLAANTTISNVYVEGYIVGYVIGTTSFTTEPSSTQNSNWALADDKGETTFANVTPVEIKTANQTNYGIGKHPELLGAKVLIRGTIQDYFSKKGVKSLNEISIESVSIPVSTFLWGTFACNQILDFDGAAVKAYVITGHEGNALIKSEVSTVAANTPLLVSADAQGAYDIPVATSGTDYSSTNKLVAGTGAEVSAESGKTRYVLSLDDNNNVAFMKIGSSAATVAKGKAYLEFDEVVSAPSFGFGDATAIDDIRSKTEEVRGDFYNLNGQRVANPTKGLYIVNGKKYIVK